MVTNHLVLISANNFRLDLMNYLVSICNNEPYEDDRAYSAAHRAEVVIKDDKMWEHKHLQVHYTTYDMFREYETVGPTAVTSDVMVLSSEPDPVQKSLGPFWYARILRIFHVFVHYRGKSTPRRMDCVFVRWFVRDTTHIFGDSAQSLERILFTCDSDKSPAFGFLVPNSIVRAVHAIPAFNHGVTSALLGPSPIARQKRTDSNEDYEYYYMNRLVRISFRIAANSSE